MSLLTTPIIICASLVSLCIYFSLKCFWFKDKVRVYLEQGKVYISNTAEVLLALLSNMDLRDEMLKG